MEEGVQKLVDKNEISDVNILYEQLKRKICSVSLNRPKSKKMELPDLYKRSLKSVLMIVRANKSQVKNKWQISVAGGFVLTKDGVAMTNYHVMEPSIGNVLVAMTHDGNLYPISEVLAADKEKDIAIIKLKGDGFAPLSISLNNDTGVQVAAISHPDGRFYSLTAGLVSRHFIDHDGGMKAHRFAVTADFAKGSSGGPILDMKGNVVGMVSSTRSIYYNRSHGQDENLQMVIKNCVPSQSFLKLIKDISK